MTLKPSGHSFTVKGGETILAAARRAGIWLPFECGWGSCGTCKATLAEGQVRCLFPEAPALSERDRRRRRVILCQSVPESDVVLEARVLDGPPENLNTSEYHAVLADVETLAPEVARFRFQLDRPADYRPGQYAILHLGDGLRRAYSMANLPGTREMELIARRYPNGPGSQTLFALSPGAELTLELPYGAAYLRETSRPLVFVAGGTGIAPILGLTREWTSRGDRRGNGLMIFYGARTPGDLVCLDELRELTRSFSQAQVIPAVNEGDAGWEGEVGLVTDALVRRLKEPWDEHEFYMAGPPVMVQAVLALLEERGVPITRVHYDSFG
ncbi:2Fe-2S iron-sulfur cluster binding domain-containing protein [Kyrpidia tusciae]|uniref:2Fe-2S iron-sulfur cluster binding domain-containing protein n=1 Tax=Kyrpidia tusciae TaxID=33943 RepID=UPI000315B03B|nr:2Fe-2S iron-sulfur cluster binding domain-containing protein [Kyrpidia tusciae]